MGIMQTRAWHRIALSKAIPKKAVESLPKHQILAIPQTFEITHVPKMSGAERFISFVFNGIVR